MHSPRKMLGAIALATTIGALSGPVTAAAQATLVDASAKSTGKTTEFLVGISSSTVSPLPLFGRRAVEVQNNGPATIYCAIGVPAVVGHSRVVAAGASWSVNLGDGVSLNCIASVAQVSGAATIVTEVR